MCEIIHLRDKKTFGYSTKRKRKREINSAYSHGAFEVMHSTVLPEYKMIVGGV